MKISLLGILNKYPHIDLAKESDNKEILNFFDRIKMKTASLSIKYDRSPNYFSLLKEQGEKYFVFLFRNKDGSIGGASTIILRTHYDEFGKKIKMGYLADLRTESSLYKRTRVEWRKTYAEVLDSIENIDEFDGCKYFYSAILTQNKDAVKALTRNKSDIIYTPLLDYNSINILGSIPLRKYIIPKSKNNKIVIRKANNEDITIIKNFLINQNSKRPYGHFFSDCSHDELNRRLNSWNDFKTDSFNIAEINQNIVGCVSPWSSSESRRLVVDELSLPLKCLGRALPLFNKSAISENDELKVLYLTHLEINSQLEEKMQCSIFNELLNFTMEQELTKKHHIVTYLNFKNSPFLKAIKKKGFVIQRTPATLFQVTSKRKFEQNELMKVDINNPMGFELGIA